MRRMILALAMLGLAAACSDRPTEPAVQKSRLLRAQSEHGAWVVRYSETDLFCTFWDADGNLVFSACSGVYTPNANAIINSRYWSTGRIANPYGRVVRFGPENAPQATIDFHAAVLGVGPTAEGLMPLCDFNLKEYPAAWTEFPIPADKLPLLICTTNWHYTLSVAGKATLIVIGDPAHSWRPFAN